MPVLQDAPITNPPCIFRRLRNRLIRNGRKFTQVRTWQRDRLDTLVFIFPPLGRILQALRIGTYTDRSRNDSAKGDVSVVQPTCLASGAGVVICRPGTFGQVDLKGVQQRAASQVYLRECHVVVHDRAMEFDFGLDRAALRFAQYLLPIGSQEPLSQE